MKSAIWLPWMCLLACNRTGGAETTDRNSDPVAKRSTPRDADPPPSTPAMTDIHPEISWQEHEFPDAGLRLALVAAIEPERIDRYGDVYVRPGDRPGEADTRYLVQHAASFDLRVAVGGIATLETWRESAQLGETVEVEPPESVTACGLPATRQVARRRVPAHRTHTARAKEQTRARDKTSIAVALTIQGRPVLVEWTIDTDQRDRYRDAEDHFFSSLRCP